MLNKIGHPESIVSKLENGDVYLLFVGFFQPGRHIGLNCMFKSEAFEKGDNSGCGTVLLGHPFRGLETISFDRHRGLRRDWEGGADNRCQRALGFPWGIRRESKIGGGNLSQWRLVYHAVGSSVGEGVVLSAYACGLRGRLYVLDYFCDEEMGRGLNVDWFGLLM